MTTNKVYSDNKLDIDVPRKQKALILQGGVALGAYEAGVFQELYDTIKDKIGENENVFDIVVGASIGAINGAILVSHVIQNRRRGLTRRNSWRGLSDKLEDIWNYISTPSVVDLIPGYTLWWDFLHNGAKLFNEGWIRILRELKNQNQNSSAINKYLERLIEVGQYFDIPASGESARRYYSAFQFLYPFTFPLSGAPHVFSSIPRFDAKFFSPFGPRTRIDNESLPFNSLRDTLEKEDRNGEQFINFPIQTRFDDRKNFSNSISEPRFLAVTVDVQNGKTVTFDSYSNKSEYEGLDSNSKQNKYVIRYDEGIGWKHIRTSAATPASLIYPALETENINKKSKEIRTFWDGSLISNTPLRELIYQHRKFWENCIGKERIWDGEKGEKIPELVIYIVDLWPSTLRDDPVPNDNDFLDDRLWDLIFHDKTSYEEKTTKMVTDYIDIISKLLPLARQSKSDEVDKILKAAAISKSHRAKDRNFEELLKGQFEVKKIMRIERQDDLDSISTDFADYSYTTIHHLMEQGREDTRRYREEILRSLI